MSVGEVYLADDFVSIAEVFRFVNDFFQKILKKYKLAKMKRKTEKTTKNDDKILKNVWA